MGSFTGDGRPGATVAGAVPQARGSRRGLPGGPRATPFVGREQELATLTGRLEAAGRGEGGVVFISGEPGIGKSRLLREIAGRARADGWLVLAGRAYDMEGMPPYLPFIEILREHLRHAPDEALAALASGAPDLCMLLPEVRERVPGLPRPPSLGPEGDRFRLFEAVSGFLINVARQSELNGLLVLLDDLHWADRTSVLLLQHLARKLGGVPFLAAAAYRTTDVAPAHPLFSVLADLAREHLCDQVLLPPLAESGTSALIRNLAGAPPTPSFSASLHQETGGNPFFIEEAVRHLLERGLDLSEASVAGQGIPEGVRQVLDQRLARLGPATNETLRTAAVLGDTFAFELLSATSLLDSSALTGAVEEGERAGMIREEGDGYAFAHALIRRAVYDGLSVARRRQIHLRAAEAMESLNKGVLDSSLAAIAHHWRLGGRPECAVAYLLRAGDAAIGVTAWEEAVRHWEGALECMVQTAEPPARQARLLEGLGDLYFLSSFEAHPAVERYVRASALYESAGDPVGAARARSRAGRSLAYPTSGFDYAGALDHLRAAEKVLRAEPPSVELGELYAALAHAESHALGYGLDEMVKAMRHVREISETIDSDFLRDVLRIQSYHLEGHHLGLQGHLAEGLAFEELACETALALKDKGGALSQWPERWREFLLAYSSDDDPNVANDAGSFQFSRVHSRAGMVNVTTNCCGWQMLDLNDPVAARAKHERLRDAQGRFLTPFLLFDIYLCGDIAGLRRLAEAGTSAVSPLNPEAMISLRALLSLAEGRWTDVETAYARRSQLYGEQGTKSLTVWNDRMLLRLARIKGDVKSAESLARESLGIALGSGAVKYEFTSRAELALLLTEAASLPEAETHLARCREILALGEDWRGLAGRAALAEAVYAAASGHSDAAETHLERAVEIFRRLSLPWDEAEAFEAWARAGQRFHRGRARQAFVAEKLDCARAVYQRIGAGQPWLDRLDAEALHLAGNGAYSAAHALPDGLTEREAEVLRLVAAGKSSREIGEELVLSLRTVERHIANIYLKTGTHGRAQLTAYTLARGLAAPALSLARRLEA
jgi:DNA-binding CsgD family transcriptional regulator